jgi:hypothetical protein
MQTNRKSALIAGIAIITMALAAVFSFGYAHNLLVIPNQPDITLSNLKTSKSLFILEILGWMIILLCDIIVAVALYVYFKNENRKLALYTAAARLIYSAILGVAIFFLLRILFLLNDSENFAGTVMSNLDSFKTTWSFGLIIFGIHLFLLGLLAIKSRLIHNIWGILLIFAGISYSFIHASNFLFPEFESQIKTAEMVLSVPMAFAEIGFAIWLFARGGKPKIIYRNLS